MGNLIKWRGGDDDRQALVKRARKLLAESESKELVRRSQAPPPVPPSPVTPWQPEIIQPGSVAEALPQDIELPRYCAVYDGEIWLARYELGNGRRHRFATSVKLTPQQKSRYGPENVITLPEGFETDAERCACCGAWTQDGSDGAIWCADHNNGRGAHVCFGRTSPSGFFICCDSCGTRGQLGYGAGNQIGLVPTRRGNFGTRF